MAMPEIEEVKDLALKYDKPTLGRLAQMGQISPTLAVMAGMMRDRVVQSEMKPPTQTVAEEVMQPMGQRMGLAAAAQMPQQPQQPRGQGLDQVPVPPEMFDEQRMAGGGIVAFQAGGTPPSFANMFTGLDTDLQALAAARKAYVGDFPTESPEERERRRREENAMRLMEIGLGIAGGESPYFASNLKGALPGIRGAAEDVKARRQEELARLAAERAEKGKVFEGVLGMRGKAAERASAEKIAEMQASKATNMKQFSNDAVAAREARLGRKLTEAEEAETRAGANREYVTLTAALTPRTISAEASRSQAATAGERVETDKIQTAIKSYTEAFDPRKRSTLPKDVRDKIRAAERAENEGDRAEGQRLRLEVYNSFREAQGLAPSTVLPGGTLRGGAAPAAGKAPPLPPGFVAQ